MMKANCTFHYFKPRGKWYTTERGVFPPSEPHSYNDIRRETIMSANGGKMPGLMTTASNFIVIVIPDDDCDDPQAFPRLLKEIPE
jgi:hypothetical protein